MTKHVIYARRRGVKKDDMLPVPLIKRCVREALEFEGVDLPCEVSVLITDDRGIRGINLEFRGIDEPTDVLSFPMIEFQSAGWANRVFDEIDPDTDLFPLGEIVLSAERIHSQAKDYGHTAQHETAYLTVHSVLHLLGYDHVDEAEDKRQMREREKRIMRELKEVGYDK